MRIPQWASTLDMGGALNCMKAALVTADRIRTVSPTYAREITTSAFGCGLEGVLRARGGALDGILNGIDGAVWSPSVDPHLPSTYTAEDLGSLEEDGAPGPRAGGGKAIGPEALKQARNRAAPGPRMSYGFYSMIVPYYH